MGWTSGFFPGQLWLLYQATGSSQWLAAAQAWTAPLASQASLIVERLSPRWVVPMHYRTSRINFLEPIDDFLERFEHVEQLTEPVFDTASLPPTDGPLIVVPAVP